MQNELATGKITDESFFSSRCFEPKWPKRFLCKTLSDCPYAGRLQSTNDNVAVNASAGGDDDDDVDDDSDGNRNIEMQ